MIDEPEITEKRSWELYRAYPGVAQRNLVTGEFSV